MQRRELEMKHLLFLASDVMRDHGILTQEMDEEIYNEYLIRLVLGREKITKLIWDTVMSEKPIEKLL